jgi:peptidoglycan/xylan/chitin deacetylase (PgdA/CDA1 family)
LILPAALRGSIGLHAAAAALAVAAPGAWPWAVGGIALNHAVLAAAGMTPRSILLGPNLRRLPHTGRAEVALTFDDGPAPSVTPRVLDLLDWHGAQATFFCVGDRARAHPALVREIVARGHAVENHSDRHLKRFAALSPHAMGREIDGAQATLTGLTGSAPNFFRAPMGLRSPLLEPLLAARQLRLVSWTRRALDGVRTTPASAMSRLTRGLAAGDILLLHDRGPAVLAVLPGLLAALAGSGLNSVTLRAGLAPPLAQQPRHHQTNMHAGQ